MNEKGVIGVLPIISQPQASFTEIHNIDGRTTNRISIMSYRSFELPDLVSYSKVRREEVWIKEAMVDRNAISLSWTSELVDAMETFLCKLASTSLTLTPS